MKTGKYDLNAILNRLCLFMIVVLFIVAWFSFVLTPMTGDLKVFMASAKQASYISNNIIVGSFKAWELKSVYSRLIAYLIYEVTMLFVSYGSIEFEYVCKFIYSLFLIAIIFFAMTNIFGKNIRRVITSTLAISVGFMAVHTGCQMQVEMTTSLLILLAYSLYFNAIYGKNKNIKLFIAGLLIGTTFFFKSVLILLAVSVVAAICIYKRENDIEFSFKEVFVVVIGSLTMMVVTSLMILVINPIEFRDIIDASAFQSTLISSDYPLKNILFSFVYFHLERLCYSPIVIIGIICMIVNVFGLIKNRQYEVIVYHLIMWLMPALFILLSYKYFIYHFVVYIFPSIIEIYHYVAFLSGEKKSILFSSIFLAPFALWYLIQFSAFSEDVKRYKELDQLSYKKTKALLNSINFDTTEEILYLDDGKGAYYLGNPSYLRYFFPLPLQRLPEDSEMTCHVESLEKAMKFEGMYISVYQSWFFGEEDRYEALKNKIDDEYEYIGSYSVFAPPHSLRASDADIKEFDLYKRK